MSKYNDLTFPNMDEDIIDLVVEMGWFVENDNGTFSITPDGMKQLIKAIENDPEGARKMLPDWVHRVQ